MTDADASEDGQAPGAGRTVEPSRERRALARRMAESRATVPHLDATVEVDMGRAAALADARAVVVWACARALREHPLLNASYRDGRYEHHERVNVAVALDGPDAPVTATLLDADTREVDALAAEIDALATTAREGALTPPQRSGATFTVVAAAVRALAVPVPTPQAAVLALGSVQGRPTARGEEVVVRPCATLTLSVDARMVAPGEAAAFLGRVRELLEGS